MAAQIYATFRFTSNWIPYANVPVVVFISIVDTERLVVQRF